VQEARRSWIYIVNVLLYRPRVLIDAQTVSSRQGIKLMEMSCSTAQHPGCDGTLYAYNNIRYTYIVHSNVHILYTLYKDTLSYLWCMCKYIIYLHIYIGIHYRSNKGCTEYKSHIQDRGSIEILIVESGALIRILCLYTRFKNWNEWKGKALRPALHNYYTHLKLT